MSEENQTPLYQMVRGFPFPFIPEEFGTKNFEDALDLVPEDGDLILASYPKTGTTWMQYILLQIRSKGEFFPPFVDVEKKIVPYVEMVGVANVYAQKKPRFYRHHIAYKFVHKNDKSKVVYTYRHPEDTVVSLWHFMRNSYPTFSLGFDEFFEHFVVGKVPYGCYFKHVLSFYEHRNDDNLLMVSYEKLHANRKEELLRIAKFLGEEYYQNLLEDDELLQKIIQRTSFYYMKKNLFVPSLRIVSSDNELLQKIIEGTSFESMKNNLSIPNLTIETHLKKDKDKSEINFFRKGIVGDGKAALSAEQRQRLKNAAEKVLKGTFFMEEWYPKEKYV